VDRLQRLDSRFCLHDWFHVAAAYQRRAVSLPCRGQAVSRVTAFEEAPLDPSGQSVLTFAFRLGWQGHQVAGGQIR